MAFNISALIEGIEGLAITGGAIFVKNPTSQNIYGFFAQEAEELTALIASAFAPSTPATPAVSTTTVTTTK